MKNILFLTLCIITNCFFICDYVFSENEPDIIELQSTEVAKSDGAGFDNLMINRFGHAVWSEFKTFYFYSPETEKIALDCSNFLEQQGCIGCLGDESLISFDDFDNILLLTHDKSKKLLLWNIKNGWKMLQIGDLETIERVKYSNAYRQSFPRDSEKDISS